jgi:hypothetical protein
MVDVAQLGEVYADNLLGRNARSSTCIDHLFAAKLLEAVG